MIGLKLDKLLVNTKEVERAARRAEYRVLTQFGYRVRRAARASIRKRKKTSAPGRPPSSHTGVLRRFILYAYQRSSSSVIIGPKRLGGKNGRALAALEYGGRSRQEGGRRLRIKVIRQI